MLRLTTASQMHLKNQIGYEYEALKLLEPTGRTPKALYADGTKTVLPYGFLVMEYLPGRPLDYHADMKAAAAVLADIHNLEVDGEATHLLCPTNPLLAILEESRAMFAVYRDAACATGETTAGIRRLIARGEALADGKCDYGERCIVNTELNSGNFLINEETRHNYLVDWEKPIYAYPQQDLGHFLAPTTTFWKTDVILTQEAILSFLHSYSELSARQRDPVRLYETVRPYLMMTCLRGVTWCSMAYVQYQDTGKTIRNEDTYRKIESYLEPGFLDMLLTDYLGE